MTGLPVRADGGFIWLIVGVFWVIAQIAGAAAKKNQPLHRPPAADNETGEATDDPFAELLRKMADVEQFVVKPPESGKPNGNPWKPGDIEALPDIKPLRKEIRPESAPKPVTIPEIDIRPKMSAFRSSVPTIKLPTMNLNFRDSGSSVKKSPKIGKILNISDRGSLRHAMISNIIFSPPKAFEQPGRQ